MKVGDTVLIFDPNHRVYRSNGKLSDGPIYREYFVPRTITGETSRSWILDGGRKIPKSTLDGIFTPAQADELAWAEEHRHKIMDRIRSYANPVLLREIAKLVGYNEAS